jgi:hypothetical protein
MTDVEKCRDDFRKLRAFVRAKMPEGTMRWDILVEIKKLEKKMLIGFGLEE